MAALKISVSIDQADFSAYFSLSISNLAFGVTAGTLYGKIGWHPVAVSNITWQLLKQTRHEEEHLLP